MTERSFFEFLGLADVERVHSQVLAWIFSKDFNAVNSNTKEVLLQKIFKIENASTIKDVLTEIANIDILIETEEELLVIENKIKSSQHSNQLHKYIKKAKKFFRIKNQDFIF